MIQHNCPRCGAFKSVDRRQELEVCWACDTWMTLDYIIQRAEGQDLGAVAIVGLLLDAQDRLFGQRGNGRMCSSLGCQGIMATGWASCDGEAGMYPYCSECLTILEGGGERVRWMLKEPV